MPKKIDIVYILKETMDTEELRYSLRSLKNLPHRYVWFVGGQPKGFKPDIALPHKQSGESKWDLIRSSMYKVLADERLSDEFYLFNDDFFVMKKVTGKWVNFADHTLQWRVDELQKEYPWLNPYARTLYKLKEELKSLGYPQVNFEVHMPMLFRKDIADSCIKQCSSPQMRSAYGNISQCEWIQHDDVKVYDLESVPEKPDFLSTNDNTFRDGAVGEYIRNAFPEPSRFEIDE